MKRLKFLCFFAVALTLPAWSFFHPHYQKNYPVYYHTIKTVGHSGKTIEIEDGSIWEVEGGYNTEMIYWKRGDTLLISPNHSFDGSRFYITNTQRNIYVSADITMAPKRNQKETFIVHAVDYYKREIQTRNSQGLVYRWKVHNRDVRFLNEWRPGQAVIFGANDWWLSSWFSSCKSIMLNIEMNEYIRVDIRSY